MGIFLNQVIFSSAAKKGREGLGPYLKAPNTFHFMYSFKGQWKDLIFEVIFRFQEVL